MREPLFFDSVLQEKIWGGRKLETEFGLAIPSPHTGEYWGISGHPHGLSRVRNGQYQGLTLDRLYREHPELFNHPADQVFPLLTKILDANDWLSVQVHPDDSYALEHEGELGKTECWYILEAAEGAEIILGHHAKTQEELDRLIKEQAWDRLLKKVPVQKGDFFYVESGTLHAIGPGILILETQQSSDTTYRVYDFDRTDSDGHKRELHLKQALDVTRLEDPIAYRRHVQGVGDLTITQFMSNEFFTVEKWDLAGSAHLRKDQSYKLFTIIEGSGQLEVDGRHYPLRKGDNFILPSPVREWTFSGEFSAIVSQI